MAKTQIPISYFLVALFKDCLFLKQNLKDVIFWGRFFCLNEDLLEGHSGTGNNRRLLSGD